MKSFVSVFFSLLSSKKNKLIFKGENIFQPLKNEPNNLILTHNQQIYFDYLNNVNNSLVCGVGPAGTGKTMLACKSAIDYYEKGIISKIILTRPMVSVDEVVGFLPGNILNKMAPWTQPLFDVFLDVYEQKELNHMIQSGVIEIVPLAYMRGRTFRDAFIIADEMQNSSPSQMIMLLTRLGDNSKIAVTGDLMQSDLPISVNGLGDLMNKLSKVNEKVSLKKIHTVFFNSSDVKRSEFVKTIMDIYSQ